MGAIDPDDIAAMRQQGDLKEFLLSLAGRTPKRPDAQPAPEPEIPRSRPGAWPDGTRSIGHIQEMTPAEMKRAIDDYRHWLAADCPPAPTACPCIACRQKGPDSI